jgi:hypothetical protein
VTPQVVGADSVRAVLRDVFRSPAYTWSEPKRGLLHLLRDWVRALQDWMGRLEAAHPLAYYLLLLVATVLLAAILTHFAYLTWRALHPRLAERTGTTAGATPPRGAAWHRAEYARLLAAGRFGEAMAERFATLVYELQAAAVLRPDRSKTPAEYAAEARLDAAGRGVMVDLVDELYRRLFGGAGCTADDVARFDARAAGLGGHRAPS